MSDAVAHLVDSTETEAFTVAVYAPAPGVFRLDYRIADVMSQSPSVQPSETHATDAPAVSPGVTGRHGKSVAPEGSERVVPVGTDARLTLDTVRGNIAIHIDGKPAYGGRIGTRDTVLAREQVIPHETGGCTYRLPLTDQDRFYGLGEKTGPVDRRGRRLKMFNRDALAYDGAISDPLYKSIPVLVKDSLPEGLLTAIYAPTGLAEVDLGVESTHFYSLRFDRNAFSVYVLVHRRYDDLMDALTTLIGRPTLPPLFTFGYFGSSMNYVEDENAEHRVDAFLAAIEEKNIPCEGMYLSSGYVKQENGERYTFYWNRRRFPDPRSFVEKIRSRGMEVCANVKPGFLVTHPWYDQLADKGFFVPDKTGKPAVTYYWGNDASLFDCTNRSAADWWKRQLRTLTDYGITGIWNDNNEYEIDGLERHTGKPPWRYTEAMCETAYQLLREVRPDQRPWVITRAGGTGLNRVARTWTGDNVSSFESMWWGNRIGLGLGLSGVPYYGHDIGGFAGPQPEPELLLRWCQTAVLQPRFSVHSWNDEGEPTELWTYPDWEERMVKMVRRHYEFLPAIYDLAIKASFTGAPIQRPLFYEFPADPGTRLETGNHLVGPGLYNIVDFTFGRDRVPVYLPAGADWYLPDEGRLVTGGRSVDLAYGFEQYRYFQRAGQVVATSPGLSSARSGFFPTLDFLVTPCPDGTSFSFTHYEDDGVTVHAKQNRYLLTVDESAVSIRADRVPDGASERTFTVTLPRGFVFDRNGERTVHVPGDNIGEGVGFQFSGTYTR